MNLCIRVQNHKVQCLQNIWFRVKKPHVGKAALQERPDDQQLSLTQRLIQQNICAGRFPADSPGDTNTLQHSVTVTLKACLLSVGCLDIPASRSFNPRVGTLSGWLRRGNHINSFQIYWLARLFYMLFASLTNFGTQRSKSENNTREEPVSWEDNRATVAFFYLHLHVHYLLSTSIVQKTTSAAITSSIFMGCNKLKVMTGNKNARQIQASINNRS